MKNSLVRANLKQQTAKESTYKPGRAAFGFLCFFYLSFSCRSCCHYHILFAVWMTSASVVYHFILFTSSTFHLFSAFVSALLVIEAGVARSFQTQTRSPNGCATATAKGKGQSRNTKKNKQSYRIDSKKERQTTPTGQWIVPCLNSFRYTHPYTPSHHEER